MLRVPAAAEPLLASLSVAFSRPTFQRVVLLVLGAVVTPGRRTVAAVLRTMRPLARGHFSSYHRVLSAARWSPWAAGRALARAVLAHVPAGQPVVLAVDDTVARHRGPRVYGRGCHRDPTRRSSHGITVRCWGHRWVVMAVMVRFPFASRPWALPVLAALFRNRDLCERQGRRFKSWPQLARQLLAVMVHWFPRRRFVLLGDGGFATHELAWFCHRHRRHVTFVFRFYDDACLYALPPARQTRGRGRGRPAKRGAKLPRPGQAVAAAAAGCLARATVDWYGGGRRDVELLGAAGGWYRDGRGLVPLRWVFVRDRAGTHRDEYFAATDPALRPGQIVGLYTGRWPIETTFQAARAHLGLETPRQRCERSVLRTTPCLFGLFSVVCLIFAAHAQRRRVRPTNAAAWYAKAEPTFSDAIATVRRLIWTETIIRSRCRGRGPGKWPTPLRELLLDCLARAA